MSLSDNVNRVILRLSGEHKIIAEYLVKVEKLLEERDYVKLLLEMKSLMPFWERELLKHFEVEERFFFPAALLGASSFEVTQLILNLQKQHGFLEKDLQTIIEVLKNDSLTRQEVNGDWLKIIRGFHKDLRRHAEIEAEELFPLADDNDECKSLIKQLLSRVPRQP